MEIDKLADFIDYMYFQKKDEEGLTHADKVVMKFLEEHGFDMTKEQYINELKFMNRSE